MPSRGVGVTNAPREHAQLQRRACVRIAEYKLPTAPWVHEVERVRVIVHLNPSRAIRAGLVNKWLGAAGDLNTALERTVDAYASALQCERLSTKRELQPVALTVEASEGGAGNGGGGRAAGTG